MGKAVSKLESDRLNMAVTTIEILISVVKDNFKGISFSCVCMFMDYNFDFIVTKAYFD